MIPFSVLDLAPIRQGETPAHAFANSLDLARHAERLGYHRYWLAEHHGMPGIASAATSVVIAHIAGGTSKIRVGSGGIMLPNHAPLVIAEQFGTLAALFPGRIDLGLGRAPGTDPLTSRALRRNLAVSSESFPSDVIELQEMLGPMHRGRGIQAVPGTDANVPLWLLGSSTFSAQLAARLGLPFAFASHFAPAQLMEALELYREGFQPSPTLAKPYTMVVLNIFAAASDAEAQRLYTSLQQQFINLRRGTPGQLQPPIDHPDWAPHELMMMEQMLSTSVIGAPATVKQGIDAFLARTRADELMVTAQIYDHAARVRSFEIVAEVMGI